jgi:hypothetical protein
MSKNTIEDAVINCRAEIAVVQAALRNLWILEKVLGDDYTGQVSAADRKPITELQALLHKKLTAKWDKLSFLSPVSPEAAALIRERAASWFQGANHEIMSWLGEHGSYYTADHDTFRTQLLRAFDIPNVCNVAKPKRKKKPCHEPAKQ